MINFLAHLENKWTFFVVENLREQKIFFHTFLSAWIFVESEMIFVAGNQTQFGVLNLRQIFFKSKKHLIPTWKAEQTQNFFKRIKMMLTKSGIEKKPSKIFWNLNSVYKITDE